MIGEGGNLGLTQAGRIEYARIGGRINTDASIIPRESIAPITR